MNNGKRFDIVLMNPPYNAGESGKGAKGEYSIESDFVNKLNKICNNVIAIYPFTRWQKREKYSKENATSGYLNEIELLDFNKTFNLNAQSKYVAIYKYDNNNFSKVTKVILNGKEYTYETYNNLEQIKDAFNELNNEYYGLKYIVEKFKDLYNKLKDKYKTMVNDGHGFIYEENRFKTASRYGINRKEKIQKGLERVKTYLKEGKYKYCLYKGSYNDAKAVPYEWHGEDPDKLFKGQICWLTNKENVKNNIKYWLSSPLPNIWIKYHLGNCNVVADGNIGIIPALDFEMDEQKFKQYVDSLNNFTKNEIKELKKFNVYNADKL